MSLPDRRFNISQTVVWREQRYHITVGFERGGTVAELFINGPKVGSDNEAGLQDGCVVFSLTLQNGADIERLAGSLGRENIDPGAPTQGVGRAASAFGLAVNLAAAIQREEGDKVKALHDHLTTLEWLPEVEAS